MYRSKFYGGNLNLLEFAINLAEFMFNCRSVLKWSVVKECFKEVLPSLQFSELTGNVSKTVLQLSNS